MGLKASDLSLNYRSATENRVLLELPISQTGNGTPYMFKECPKGGPGAARKTVSFSDDARARVAHVINGRQLTADDLLLSTPNRTGSATLLERLVFDKQRTQVASDRRTVLRTSAWPGGLPISRATTRRYTRAMEDPDGRAVEALEPIKSRYGMKRRFE